ncbi:MAG: transposase [Clostridia bacterium]|nr:transposase [Clostridia bacterium]
MNLQKRKTTRLTGYDYSLPGAYFITICTKNREKLLSEIVVGTGVLDCPKNILTEHGEIANKQLMIMSNFYDNIKIDKFVIMPNHVHLLVQILHKDKTDGPSGTPVPTNSAIAQFVSTFKRFCNKEYGKNIWQSRSNDHIIRNEQDYLKIWEYIDTNVARWEKDCFYY